ncbi:sulfotransferase family protein [Luteitalea sp.]
MTSGPSPGATGVPVRPDPPSFFRFRTPAPAAPLRRWLRRSALRLMDAGVLPGLRPLRTHVVICGFPRSGSTLLQLVAETCYPEARTYREEKSAFNAERELRRDSPLVITKQPSDLFQVDDILDFYRGLRPQAKLVLTTRDPRAILTSRYSGKASANVTRGPDGYVMSSGIWREWFAHFEYARQRYTPLVVEYADLVRTPGDVERAFSSYIGWKPTVPFDQFLGNIPGDFETKALNGVRAFDPSNLTRWQAPEHAGRIAALLDEMPDLPELLIRLGYETDTTWTAAYRSA